MCACVHACLHPFEVRRRCDSSSRMSWLYSGRPTGLPSRKAVGTDNLSSSLGDDSPSDSSPRVMACTKIPPFDWGSYQGGAPAVMPRPSEASSWIYFSFAFAKEGEAREEAWAKRGFCRRRHRWNSLQSGPDLTSSVWPVVTHVPFVGCTRHSESGTDFPLLFF